MDVTICKTLYFSCILYFVFAKKVGRGGKYETGYPSTADNHIPHDDAIKNWENRKEKYGNTNKKFRKCKRKIWKY